MYLLLVVLPASIKLRVSSPFRRVARVGSHQLPDVVNVHAVSLESIVQSVYKLAKGRNLISLASVLLDQRVVTDYPKIFSVVLHFPLNISLIIPLLFVSTRYSLNDLIFSLSLKGIRQERHAKCDEWKKE